MIAGNLIVAYHGCDIVVRDDLVSGRLRHLDPSENDYDWLGPGAYFFEGDPTRAFKFANTSAGNPEKRFTARRINTPAVVGAVLCLNHCLDMTTQDGIDLFEDALLGLQTGMVEAGDPQPPVNTWAPGQDRENEVPILRKLDCAVFTTLHTVLEVEGKRAYDAVRGAFPQGKELAPHSFRRDSHIQIALRNPDCVVGWFLPRPADEEGQGASWDRLLGEEAYEISRKALLEAQANKPPKPRMRANPA